MRLYIVGCAHLKWAIRFMYGFVRMEYVDGKWKGVLQHPSACGVYDQAKLVDTLIAADMPNDRDLCFYLDRVREAFASCDLLEKLFENGQHYGYRGPYDIPLNIKPVVLRMAISRDVCECGWLLDHDAEHCWKCECGKDCTFGNCKTQVYRIVERDSDYKIANVLRHEKPPTIDYYQEDFDE